MESVPLGRSPLRVTRVGLGCMSLGTDPGRVDRIVGRALDLGVRVFDTADLYDHGENEKLVGRALGPVRDRVVLASKVGNRWRPDGEGWDWVPDPAYLRRAVERSLRRLGTDVLDLLQLHGGTADDPLDDVIATFEALVDEGSIRAWGVSSIRPNVVRRVVAAPSLASVMVQLSLLDRRAEEAILPSLRGAGVPAVARGPLAQGLLAGRPARAYLGRDVDAVRRAQRALEDAVPDGVSPARAAVRYALDTPGVAMVVVGASSAAQLDDTVAAAAMPPLGPDTRRALEEAAPALRYASHR